MLILVMAMFVAIALGGLAVELVEKFGSKMAPPDRQFLETIVQTFSFQGLGLIIVTAFIWWQKTTWTEAFGLKSSTPKRVISWGILGGLLVLPIAWGLQEVSVMFFNHFEVETMPQEIIQKLQSGKETVPHQAYLFFAAVVGAPIIEEIFFRGIFYPTIKQLGFKHVALWVTAIIFALSHVNKQTFLPLLVFALVLTWLYEETDNLLTSIIAHSTFNAANFLLLIFKDPITQWFHKLV